MSDIINSTINGYTILYPLGMGGMADVYYAENKIKKPVAIKILKLEHCKNEELLIRFKNEATTMLKLNHPNIRQVYDYCSFENRPCIIMEYLDGQDLVLAMNNGLVYNNENLTLWWNQIVDALNYTHKLGIIHRDIKPSNICLTSLGIVKILDFGIAKSDVDSLLTQQFGNTMGTPMYMSPEQVKDMQGLDYKTDIYSLAVTFYHLLLKNPPYDSTLLSEFEIKKCIVEKSLVMDRIPVPWKKLLNKYLEKDPVKRQNLSYFPVLAPTIKKARPTWIIISIILFLGLIAGGFFFLNELMTRDEEIETKELKISKLNKEIKDLKSVYSEIESRYYEETNKNEYLQTVLDKFSSYSFKVGEFAAGYTGHYSSGSYLHFNVSNPIILKSVYISPESTGSINIKLYKQNGSFVDESGSISITSSKSWKKCNLNFEITEPGRYYLSYSGNVKLFYYDTDVDYDKHKITNLVELTGFSSSSSNYNSTNNYGYFFEWELSLFADEYQED